ncbi:MAG: thiamine diphosphokinase [Clostridiales bacterium]|nr:thiamine diphosphokinase [Clostridiales bacterium]
MRACVFAGGPGIDPQSVGIIAADCDLVIAADSGASVAVECGIIPSRVVGDLDSIDSETLEFLREKGVEFDTYPVEKDMTDSELCLRQIPEEYEIVMICSLSGRPDHVLSNMMVALRLHGEGRDITLTDGVSDFIPMCGKDSISISGLQNSEELVISMIPFTEVKGVSTEGLYYKLDNKDLIPGSSLTVSNRVTQGAESFSISANAGNMGVLIVREF